MGAQQEQDSDKPTIDKHSLLCDLLVQELPRLRKSVAARIWKQDLARDPAAVSELTDEVLQEVTVRALANVNRYDPRLRGHAWLDLFALNILHEQRRRIYQERQIGIATDTLSTPSIDGLGENPVEQLSDRGGFDKVQVQELLDLARPADREFLHARYVLGLTPEEIAVQSGLNMGAVYVRLSRARSRLREELSKLD